VEAAVRQIGSEHWMLRASPFSDVASLPEKPHTHGTVASIRMAVVGSFLTVAPVVPADIDALALIYSPVDIPRTRWTLYPDSWGL